MRVREISSLVVATEWMHIAHWAKGVQSSWEKTLCPVLLQGRLLVVGERNNPLGAVAF